MNIWIIYRYHRDAHEADFDAFLLFYLKFWAFIYNERN